MTGGVKDGRGTAEERFWAKVNKDGQIMPAMETKCWEWTASHKTNGGGQFNAVGRSIPATRFSYELEYGPIPKRERIFHLCTNNHCVRPEHLILGVKGGGGTKSLPVVYIDGEKHKHCSKCKMLYPYTIEFFHSGGQNNTLKSCCKKCSYKQNRANREKYWARHLLNNAKESAKNNGWPITLTVEIIHEILSEQEGRCYWFGIPLKSSAEPRSPWQPSLDRLDNSKGYTRDNVVVSSFLANIGRNRNTTETFVDFLKELPESLPLAPWRSKDVKNECGIN